MDAGERRVGLALSDELRLLATPLRVLVRAEAGAVFRDIARLVQEEAVAQVIVGWPLNADGSRGSQARRAERFAERLRTQAGAPVALWDERLSTVEAERRLREEGRSTRRLRQQGAIDAFAAAVMLQDYLDAQTAPITHPLAPGLAR